MPIQDDAVWGIDTYRIISCDVDAFMDTLPNNSKHRGCVLGIESNVSVTLARKKVTLAELLRLVPGSMLTFDIHCDQPLTLEAENTPIAIGETVKIGDKFGMRIRELKSF